MCGIFGEYNTSQQLTEKSKFLALNEINRLRGPDSMGYWTDNKYCQLGFRRLAILDLTEAGNQPMISPIGRYAIMMNGEVYNYVEIQQKLGITKSNLKSSSDTEIVLLAIEALGIENAIETLNGMFAISVFDMLENKLYLIRDFSGIKPLYFGIINNTLIFGSQYDQIFNHPAFSKKEINHNSLCDYLRLGYIPAPNAFFKNTFQVEPGQIVSIDKNLKVEKSCYFEFKSIPGNYYETEQKTTKDFLNIFQNVVSRQLRSDLKVGSFLSGGIDSPLVTAIAKGIKPKFETFTVGTEDKRFDESVFVSEYVKELNVENHFHKYDTKTLLNNINDHFKAYSEPFGDFSSLPTFQVSKMAKKYFTVILSGDGGDELFWGYPRFLEEVSNAKWFNISPKTRLLKTSIFRKLGRDISYGVNLNTLGDWVLEKQSHNRLDFLKELIEDFDYSEKTKQLYSFNSKNKSSAQILSWLRWNEFYGHLQRVLLKVDRASMFHSLEVRVPFLDKETLDFAAQIHPELSIKHSEPKYVLKKALEEFIPANKINKSKYGFSIEIDKWLRNELRDEVIDLLLNRDPYPHNTFNKPAMKKRIDDFISGKNHGYWGIWIFYALQKWAEQFGLNK